MFPILYDMANTANAVLLDPITFSFDDEETMLFTLEAPEFLFTIDEED